MAVKVETGALVVVVNGQKVVYSVTTPDLVSVTTVKPVVIGTSEHLFSEQEVTVITVVEFFKTSAVEVTLTKAAEATEATAAAAAIWENCIVIVERM